jgi:maleylacetoacetate isomerase/maleylpyruvate isomerase
VSDPARFELFSFWRTSATCRVRVALNVKGLPRDEYNVNMDAGEQRSAEFLRINPTGAIPALIDRAVQEYVETFFAEVQARTGSALPN